MFMQMILLDEDEMSWDNQPLLPPTLTELVMAEWNEAGNKSAILSSWHFPFSFSYECLPLIPI